MAAKSAAPVTVQDIARATGLSPSSVSAVLSGQQVKRRISLATVDRVLDAARRLRYVPNVTARSTPRQGVGHQNRWCSVLTSYEAPVILVSQALRALDRAIAARRESAVHYEVNVQMFMPGASRTSPASSPAAAAMGPSSATPSIPTTSSSRPPGCRFRSCCSAGEFRAIPAFRSGRKPWGGRRRKSWSGPGAASSASSSPPFSRRRPGAGSHPSSSRPSRRLACLGFMITCDSLEERDGYGAMQRFLASRAQCDGVFALSDGLAIGAVRDQARRPAHSRGFRHGGGGDNTASRITSTLR